MIFPEGTCINNTSVMQFKKGSFEVGGTIYPVAIKYDPIFGDAFWNSSENGMASYIYLMMTSWAIGKTQIPVRKYNNVECKRCLLLSLLGMIY